MIIAEPVEPLSDEEWAGKLIISPIYRSPTGNVFPVMGFRLNLAGTVFTVTSHSGFRTEVDKLSLCCREAEHMRTVPRPREGFRTFCGRCGSLRLDLFSVWRGPLSGEHNRASALQDRLEAYFELRGVDVLASVLLASALTDRMVETSEKIEALWRSGDKSLIGKVREDLSRSLSPW